MERQDEKPRAYPEQEAGRREEGVPEEGPAAADADREYSDTSSEQAQMGREPSEGSQEYADTGREYSEAGRDESVEASPTSEGQPVRQAGSDEYAVRDRAGSTEDASRPGSASYTGEETPAQRQAYQDREPATAGTEPETTAPVGSSADSQFQGRSDAATAATPRGTYGSAEEPRSGDPAEAQSFAGPSREAAGMGTSESEAAYDAAAERKAVTPPSADAGQADAAPASDQGGGGLTGSGAQGTPGAVSVVEQTAVLSRDDAQTFQVRWETIQGQFIDDPHAATEQADALVGEVMERLSRLREDYLRQLRGALGDGSDTEAMRVALQRYRAFFQTLLG
jgi:hypothetical protein